MDIPQGLLAIHYLAQNASGKLREFSLTTRRVQPHAKYMVPNIEMRIPFPCRIAHMIRRHNCDLPVARNQVQFRIDLRQELVERNRTIENRDTGDVERNLFALQVKESRVSAGQQPAWLRRFAGLLPSSSLR